MGITKVLIWAFTIIWSLTSCKANQINEITMLKIKEPQIEKALDLLIKEESKYGSIQKGVVIIKLESTGNGIELRMGVLPKESVKFYLTGKKDKPVGFFDYDEITVIVFGEKEDLFFERTSNKKDMPFLEPEPKLKLKDGEIPPPPVIYEPIIWIYHYNGEILKMIDKGRFTLLS